MNKNSRHKRKAGGVSYNYMKTLLSVIFIIGLTSLIACRDRNNIAVTGQIKDAETKRPIANAEVVILCWYMSGIDDASFEKKTVTTDEHGNYKVHFDKGHRIDVASKAIGYGPSREYNSLSANQVSINFQLAKAKSNPTLIKLLSTDYVGDETPFLRVRMHSMDNRDNLDLKNVETFGFDIKSLKTTTDTSNADLWFKIIHTESQPKTICANRNGGIVPIHSKDIKSSFFFERPFAPTIGYVQTYTLEGDEEGFFVLLRDRKTYGKIIFDKVEVDVSSPDGKGGFYKDFGKNFSCLYQPNGTTDLSYSTPDLDLENFLVDCRLR